MNTVDVPEEMEEYQFLQLAKKFRYHEPHGEKECMVCEAIEIIEGGRFEIGTQPLPEDKPF